MKSAYVRKAQAIKDTPYSTIAIGGKEEYAKWQVTQIEVNAYLKLEYDLKQLAIKHKAIDAFMEPAVTPDGALTELLYCPQPPKSLYTKFKTICTNIWRNAFDPT